MVTTVIVTHGKMAQELLGAAKIIVGELPQFVAVSLDWEDSLEKAKEKTQRALASVNSSHEVLILTDMYGGTPYNVASSFYEPGRVEVVTGVNLPMVVRLGCPGATDKPISELAEWIQGKTRASICRAGEAPQSHSEPGCDPVPGTPGREEKGG